MSNNRAIYIPPGKRRRQPPSGPQQGQPSRPSSSSSSRFHGAFTGGFSAGHFNTVGTREGWTPSTDQRRQQRVEDFMDDEDMQEWGGPTSVKQDFTDRSSNKNNNNKKTNTSKTMETPLLDSHLLFAAPRPLRAGPRLLRYLGWREGVGAAFVPTTTTTTTTTTSGSVLTKDDKGGGKDNLAKSLHLSKRKLRQIELQSTKSKIPPSKHDQCGLGFVPFEKAPEFQRYRQQRQELANARARGQSNVYRMSHLLMGQNDDNGGDNDGGDHGMVGELSSLLSSSRPLNIMGDDEFLNHDTIEDFVGTRSSSGFALRDDDDDAYDPHSLGGDRNNVKPFHTKGGNRLSQEYNTEIIDTDDDNSDIDDDNGEGTPLKGKTKTFLHASEQMNRVLGGALASWAGKDHEPLPSSVKETTTTNKDRHEDISGSLTNSGRPPIAGFKMGMSMESINKKRYPGPDVPRNYELKRHIFGPNERPSIIHTIGRAMQLEENKQEQQERRARQGTRQENEKEKDWKETKQSLPQPLLVGGNQFVTLATAMKNRFTSATETMEEKQHTPTAGLYQPPKIQKNKLDSDVPSGDTTCSDSSIPKVISVQRSTQSFMPLPLVCKRFGVSVPRLIPSLPGTETSVGRVTEASYFEKEVLSTVRDVASTTMSTTESQSGRTSFPPPATSEAVIEAPTIQVPRPTKEELKAIFDPESDNTSSSSADTDLDSLDGREASSLLQQGSIQTTSQTEGKEKSIGDGALIRFVESKDLVPYVGANNDMKTSVEDDGTSSGGSSSSLRHRESKHKRSHKKRQRKDRKKKSHSSRRTVRHSDERSSDDDDDDPEGSNKEKKRRRRTRRRDHDERKHSKKRRKKG